MANTVDKVITIAKAEVGYLEKKTNAQLDNKTANAGKNNFTKYWRDMASGMNGQSWCNCFVNWCFVKAYGEKNARTLLCTDGGWSYYTPTSASYFKTKKQWYTSKPQIGDIIYFKNSTRIHHVGIVYNVDSSYVYTIEGNTSAGSAVIPNGGQVAMKKYALSNSAIAGYGRPKYDTTVVSNTPSYQMGQTYTLQYDSYIWTEPVNTSATVKYQAKFGSLMKADGTMPKGSKVTCQGLTAEHGNIWMKCPLGYMPAYYSGKVMMK